MGQIICETGIGEMGVNLSKHLGDKKTDRRTNAFQIPVFYFNTVPTSLPRKYLSRVPCHVFQLLIVRKVICIV